MKQLPAEAAEAIGKRGKTARKSARPQSVKKGAATPKKKSTARPKKKGAAMPKTNYRFIEKVKRSVVSSTRYVEGKTERTVEIKDEKTAAEFARRYKSFVFGVLKRHCGFSVRGEGKEMRLLNGMLDAEEVFHQVLIRFFKNRQLKRLDLFKEGAGKTPFRNYLSRVVQNTFRLMVGKDLVQEYGPDGRPVMVEARDEKGRVIFETDEKGVIRKDAAGNSIVKMKPRMISRYALTDIASEWAWGDNRATLWAQPPTNEALQDMLLDIVTIAYVITHEKDGCRKGWAYQAIADMFEKGEDDRVVADRLLRDGAISSMNAFYTAKSRFADQWRTTWMKLYRDVVRSEKGARVMSEDRMCELWREARKRLAKDADVSKLRENIAAWAVEYAERATKKDAKEHARHRL